MPGDSTLTPRDHVVHFYASDDELTAGAARFLVGGLSAGAISIVVASSAHLAAFEATAPEFGVDITAARRDGMFITFDAEATFERFVVAESSGSEAFVAEFAALIRRCLDLGLEVRVYGEMVSLLWQAGQVAAAIELERLWNDVQLDMPFALYCAYPSSTVEGERAEESFRQIGRHHSAVIGFAPSRATAHDECVLDGVERSLSFPCDLTSVGESRRFVAATLGAWDLESVIPDAVLVVSELATNAVQHAASSFTVALTWEGTTLCLSVSDSSSARPLVNDALPAHLSGRGLRVVSSIANRWGTDRVADGKLVWAELDV